jgi:hypothetical protein
MSEPVAEEHEGLIKRVRRRVDVARYEIAERATEIGARVPAARSAVRTHEHDRSLGGEITAGAIAILVWAYFVGQLLVSSAVLNASLYREREQK